MFQAQLVKWRILFFCSVTLHHCMICSQHVRTSYPKRTESSTRQLWKPKNSHLNELLSSYIYHVADVTFNNLDGISFFLWWRTYFSKHFVYINGVRHNIQILLHFPPLADFQITQKGYTTSPSSSSHLSFNT